MFKFPMSQSNIQRRIFYSFLVVIIMPTTLISISSYLISIHLLEEKVSSAFVQNLNYIGSNVERNLDEWENITDYIYVNHTIRDVMKKNYKTDAEFFPDMLEADHVMNDFALGSNLYSEISSLVIIGGNGKSLLYGADVSDLDIDLLKQKRWYKEAKRLNGKVHLLGIERKQTLSRVESYVISLARTINMDDQNIAMIYLTFNEGFLRKILKDVVQVPQTELQIIDNNNRIVFNSLGNNIFSNYSDANKIKRLHNDGQNYSISKNDDKKMLVAHHYIEKYDWWVTEEISYDELIKDNNLIFYTTAIAFIFSFIISGILWFMVTRSIVKPIEELTKTMRSINGADDGLVMESNINSNDEIGVLNESFHFMLERINTLFENVLHEQAKKKDAEYRALQAQINPHFLYNTLNTIRWMAIIQKADNIQVMVEVLGRLIRNTFKHEGPFVTIREELAFIKDFIYIQQIRYKDKFKVEYFFQEEVLDSLCVKFIMQPVLENAIFHGIEPKEGHSTIQIRVEKVDNLIRISIHDNGIGMSEEQIKSVFTSSVMGGIGLKNVDERIKYIYGVKNGIKVESKLGEFTCVVIQFPYRTKENEHV